MPPVAATPSASRRYGAVITILTLLVILAVAVEYAQLRARYDWVYSWYASITGLLPPGTPVSIGPTRIVLAFERPWLSAFALARPLPQTAAEFLLRAIRQKINPEFLLFGPGMAFADPLGALKNFVETPSAWSDAKNNPLYGGNSDIPYYSDLVQGYYNQTHQTGKQGDLSLEILWLHGYEEYVRQRFTGAATSVLGEWNFMFAKDTPDPLPAANTCDLLPMAGGFVSAGVAGAGVGAMVGAPEGGIGALPGAIVGFLVGGVGSLLGKTRCF